MRQLILLSVVAFLAACQTADYEGNENSPYYPIPVGSILTLTRTVTIPAEQVAVFLQGGEVVPAGRTNQYYPHCKFELIHRRDTGQTVEPDDFEIIKVVQETSDSVALDSLQLAQMSAGIGLNVGMDHGGASLQTYRTRLMLRSARQPDVYLLSCGQSAYPSEGQHVSIMEIRKVLGKIFTLQLAPHKS
ncbi:MAG: hypothetical protein WB402_09740 [Sulfuricaulis sp.]|uniref:hypothetical protein n=1 Tax=Sulfuricaulis sp. TaxID=2003553 RepID=UPI003C3EFFB2